MMLPPNLLPTDQCCYLFITCNLPAHVCLQYTLSSSESASEVLPFTVDRVSGEVTVSGDLDHENKSEYTFNVAATGKTAAHRSAKALDRLVLHKNPNFLKMKVHFDKETWE